VVAAVLGSAVIHAGWNAAAKAIGNRLVASALMGAGYLIFGGLWCFVAVVPAAASWPYLITSVALQTGYLLLLTAAYAHGEFRQVYPLARGTAPVLVTAFSLGFLGDRLAVWQLVGIALIVGSLAALVSVPRGLAPHRSARGRGSRAGLLLAVATGVVIATYSLVDGLGVRSSGSAAGYAAWLMMLQGPLLIAVCALLARPRHLVAWTRAGGMRTVLLGLAGGLASTVAYAIVLWAQDRASLAIVSTLRESSVLFAGVIGTLFFAEQLSPRQLVAAVGVVAGIALIQLG
jgi:drug/metabolite transporter (DMT)-like permease